MPSSVTRAAGSVRRSPPPLRRERRRAREAARGGEPRVATAPGWSRGPASRGHESLEVTLGEAPLPRAAATEGINEGQALVERRVALRCDDRGAVERQEGLSPDGAIGI